MPSVTPELVALVVIGQVAAARFQIDFSVSIGNARL